MQSIVTGKQDDTLFNEVYRSTEITYKESGSKTKTVKCIIK